MKNNNLIAPAWPDYELIDSGNNRKLERFGAYKVIRPEPQAIWRALRPERWKHADAEFSFSGSKGNWKKKNLPDEWTISVGDMKAALKPTNFKHVGIFPEQVPNWQWICECVRHLRSPRVLNLFGYTGIASIAAARAGAIVTHVDASKQANTWAKFNAGLSKIPDGHIRYITDDALKFVEREFRRGSIYEGVILDPPAFGRGPKGEVWRIEENFSRLIDAVKKLIRPSRGSFFLLNGYAAGYSSRSFSQAVEEYFPTGESEFGELNIEEAGSKRLLTSGIYARVVL